MTAPETALFHIDITNRLLPSVNCAFTKNGGDKMVDTMTQACKEADKDAPVVMGSPDLRSGAPPERKRLETPGFSSSGVPFTRLDPVTVLLPFESSVEWL